MLTTFKTRHTALRALLVLIMTLWVLHLSSRATAAEQIRVVSADVVETPTVELEPKEKAVLRVYLMSAGDPLDGFTLELVRRPEGKLVSRKTSDAHGVLEFPALGPGDYRIYFRRPEAVAQKSSTRVAEIRLEKER